MLIQPLINTILSVKPDFVPVTILDIGSRDLGQSIEFLSIFPNSKIYAFEPNPEQFKICLEVSQYYENIEVIQLALNNIDGMLDFYVTHGNVGASSLLEPINVPFASSQHVTKIQVPTIRLDMWMESKNIVDVDIMWLDTQGVELNVLKSMGESIKRVSFIHCEASELPYYKGHLLKDELEEYLVSAGFEVYFKNDTYHPFNEGDIIAINKNLI